MLPSTNRVLFCVLALAPGVLAQGEVDARSTAKKGSSVWLVHETKQTANMTMQAQELTVSQQTARTVHVQIKDVDEAGNFKVETTIVRVHGNLTLPMEQGDITYDSAAPEGEREQGQGMSAHTTKQLTAVAGMTFAAKVNPAGEVLELGDGAAAILAKDADKTASMHSLTSGSLKQLVADAFGLLPAKRTAAGAKWTRERVEFHGRMPTKQKLDLTLTIVEPEAFEVEATGSVDLAKDALTDNKEVADDAETMRQIKSTKVTSGKLTSKQKVSRADGFVQQATSTMKLEMETEESQMGAVTTKMELTTSIKRTTEEAAVPKKAATPAAPADGKK